MLQTRQVFDGSGNLVREESYEVPDEVVAREQARVHLQELKARGKASWTSSDLADIADDLIQLLGV